MGALRIVTSGGDDPANEGQPGRVQDEGRPPGIARRVLHQRLAGPVTERARDALLRAGRAAGARSRQHLHGRGGEARIDVEIETCAGASTDCGEEPAFRIARGKLRACRIGPTTFPGRAAGTAASRSARGSTSTSTTARGADGTPAPSPRSGG